MDDTPSNGSDDLIQARQQDPVLDASAQGDAGSGTAEKDRSGILYVVSTPIGNLSDITVRAIEILRTVDLVACEDTRKSRTLLQRWQIPAKVMSLHKFSEARKTRAILKRLDQNEHVALITDAGTPALSDPGSKLVREALDAGFRVTPVPGASAIGAALSVSGMDGTTFSYLGYAPRKDDERRRFFGEMVTENRTCVFFETARRLEATMRVAAEILGETRIAVMRELTKMYEEMLHGTAVEILETLDRRESLRGEITVVVEASGWAAEVELEQVVVTLMSEGFSGKKLADEARKRFGVRKSEAYNVFLQMKKRGS